MNKEEFVVNLENDNDLLRIDKYLPDCFSDMTRSELKKYFDKSLVKVNGKIVKPSFLIKTGDYIEVEEYPDELSDIMPEDIPLEIVYEDDDLVVVNKPSGMVVHPALGHSSGTLVNALMYHYQTLSNINGENRAGIVHRIDKDTSGLLVVCKTNFAHQSISEQLKTKECKRTYFAIVTGSISHNLGRIDAPIGRDPENRQKMAVVENGKPAVTNFKVIDRFKNFTLLEVSLETGRTHQIRVHMAYINHPVVGDPLYGVKKQVDEFGQYLHAKKIGFRHPRTNKYMEFEVDLPNEFITKINELKKEE